MHFIPSIEPKRILAFLTGIMLCVAGARGGEFSAKVVTSTAPKGAPTATFAIDTPKVFALFKTKGAQKGDKVRSVWIADDVGAAAPAGTKVGEETLTLEGDTEAGEFSVSKPTKGWPAGKYHVDIYANDKVAATAKFTIGSAEETAKKPEKPMEEKPAKKSEEPATESVGSTDDAQYTFKVHNENVQRITQLLASEDGKKFFKFDIGEGIDVDETVTVNWDKSTNQSGCNWYVKAVYADKSVGEAVEFDFCEEDLVISF